MSQSPISTALRKRLKNRFWRLNNLYWIEDKSGKSVRFTMSREQYDFYKNQWHRSVILKARQLGFTTEVCIMQLDAAVFMKKKCAMIAHTLHDAQRLFREKTQYAYDRLPVEIKAANPILKMNTEELVLKKGGSVTVSTSFRGGTLYSLHVSEFGKICAKYPDKAREIVSGAFESVPADGYITLESTAEGREGKFYEFCMEAQKSQIMNSVLTALDWKFFFYSWHLNIAYSLKDEEGLFIPQRLIDYFNKLKGKGIELTRGQMLWYTKKEKTLGFDMLREYPSTPEEAFQQTIEGAYYAKQITALRIKGKIGKVAVVNPHLPVMTFWDLGVNDSMSVWFIRRVHEKCYQVIDYYENNGEGLRHYFGVLKKKAEDLGYEYEAHYAPHDIRNREMGSDAKSRLELAAEGYDIDGEIYAIDFQVVPRISAKNDAIEMVRELLPFCEFDEERCDQGSEDKPSGLSMLEKYRKEWNDKAGCWRDRPLHDYTSNCADSFATFAQAMNLDYKIPDTSDLSFLGY